MLPRIQYFELYGILTQLLYLMVLVVKPTKVIGFQTL